MNTTQPLICKDCWPKKTNHYEPCEHAMQVYNQGVQAGKEAIRERLETQSVDVAPAEGNEALTQPQAASAGALRERIVSREEFNNAIADEAAQSCVDWNDPERRKEALRYIIKQIWNEAVSESAAHDQKVRAEVHESYEPMKEALSQFMKATLRIANDAAEIVTLRLPCHCDAQDGTPCTRCNVIREIRALAAPAASKPANKGTDNA